MIYRKFTPLMTLSEWMASRPYKSPEASDHYYLQLTNSLFNKFSKEFKSIEHIIIAKSKRKIINLCGFLTQYFEDFFSGMGIYRSFLQIHFEKYGKYLPFDYREEEYDPEDINISDLAFLIWYYASVENKEFVVNPKAKPILELAGKVFDWVDTFYEEAPPNNRLVGFLNLPDEEKDYYEVRNRISWLAKLSYLFACDIGNREEQALTSYYEELHGFNELAEKSHVLANNLVDTYTINVYSSLLHLRAKDWYAQILRQFGRNKLAEKCQAIPRRVEEYFGNENEDDELIYLRHLATDKVIKVRKDTLNELPDQINPHIMGGFVEWEGIWWLSGTYAIFSFDPNREKKEKSDIQSLSAFQPSAEGLEQSQQYMYRQFVEFNEGKQIRFFENSKELVDFYHGFIEHHNRSLKLSTKGSKKGMKKAKEQGFSLSENKLRNSFSHIKETGLIYFNKTFGIEIFFGANHLIPDLENPFFDPESDEDDYLRLIVSPQFSKSFVKHLNDAYPLPRLTFPGLPSVGREKETLEFLLDFYHTGSNEEVNTTIAV